MKRTLRILSCILLAAALAGCKSQFVSRTYKANMDDTWNAVLAVAGKVSKDAPKADKVGRRIVTGMVSGGIIEESSTVKGAVETKRSGKMWRAIITLAPEYGGTKVTVKIEKANSESNTDFASPDGKQANVGLTLWSSNTDWQTKVLDEIAAELAAKSK